MIFDCFLYNGEKEMLDIRMDELSGIDDLMHIAVMGTKTHSGLPNTVERPDTTDRLCVAIVEDLPDGLWDIERAQRNKIKDVLTMFHPDDNDTVIISDADEIPDQLRVTLFHTGEIDFACLEMDMYGYYLNCSQNIKWDRARIMRWSYLKNRTPEEVRNSGYDHVLEDGGWHFSYIGGVEAIMKKIQSYSHQEFNTPEFNNKDRILEKMSNGESLFNDEQWTFMPVDQTFPRYVYNNQYGKLSHLIKHI